MIKNYINTALFSAVLAVSFSAISAGPASVNIEHPTLKSLSAKGYTVEPSSINGSLPVFGNLISWLITDTNSGVSAIVMTTPDQKFFISGEVSDHKGSDPLASYLTSNRFSIGADDNGKVEIISTTSEKFDSAGDEAWQALSQTFFFAPNDEAINSNTIVYVFVDPNCVNCAKFWQHQEAYQGNGITFRLLPISFVNKENGLNKIASMSLSENPFQAYAVNSNMFDSGGYPAFIEADESIKEKVDINHQIMKAFGAVGTPTIVFQNADGTTEMADIITDDLLHGLGGRRAD